MVKQFLDFIKIIIICIEEASDFFLLNLLAVVIEYHGWKSEYLCIFAGER